MGSVSELQILNASRDVVRVTWVGVPGATAYRLAWGRSEGTARPALSSGCAGPCVRRPDCPPRSGGPTRQQLLPGSADSAEIRGLEGGVSYAVRVTALVGDREGAPVSIVVTTRRPGCWGGGTGARGLRARHWSSAWGAGPGEAG